MDIYMPPIPLSGSMPLPEANAPLAGSGTAAARDDHTHQRLSSGSAEATNLLDVNGEASITFTRSFAKNPIVVISEVEATDLPSVTFKVVSYTLTGAVVTGCVIKGKRRRALPNIGSIVLLTNLITALNNFLPEVNAAGARFSYCAVASSQP